MIKGNYYANHYNKFISTKATQEHQWDKLGEHIAFYSSKQYFFVAGEGLSNSSTSTVLSKPVTHLGHTSTLQELLTSKKIFTFIQHSCQGLQNYLPTRRSNNHLLQGEIQSTTASIWFITHVIGAKKDLAE
jgi:hypothetical protein